MAIVALLCFQAFEQLMQGDDDMTFVRGVDQQA
jgi:hypothetical protein